MSDLSAKLFNEFFSTHQMPDKQQKAKSELQKLVSLGESGQFPLFEPSWITEFCQHGENKYVSVKNAKEFLEEKLKTLDTHHSYQRKKEALFAVQREERRMLIRCLFKLVENNLLDNMKLELQ